MSIIIRLQNLPWAANSVDIRRYFSGLSIPEGGVHIVGGEKGDAFIAFSTDEDARQAMERDGGKIKDMKVKLLLSSRAEMTRVIEQARNQTLSLQTPAAVKAAANDSDRRKVRRSKSRSPSPSRSRKDREKSPVRDRRKSHSKRDRSRSRSPPRRQERDRDVDRRSDRSKRDDRSRYDDRNDSRYKSSRDYSRENSRGSSQDRKFDSNNKTQPESTQNKSFDIRVGATPQTFDSRHLDGGGLRTGGMEFNPRQGNLPDNSASYFDPRNQIAHGSNAPPYFPPAMSMASLKPEIKRESLQPPSFPALEKFSSLFKDQQKNEGCFPGNYETKRPSPTPAALAPKVESNSPYATGYSMSSRVDQYNSGSSNFGNCPDPTASTYGTVQTAEKGAIPAVPHDRRNIPMSKPIYGAEPHARYEQIPEANQASKSSTAPYPINDPESFNKRSNSSIGSSQNSQSRRSRFDQEISVSRDDPFAAPSGLYSSRSTDINNRSLNLDLPSAFMNNTLPWFEQNSDPFRPGPSQQHQSDEYSQIVPMDIDDTDNTTNILLPNRPLGNSTHQRDSIQMRDDKHPQARAYFPNSTERQNETVGVKSKERSSGNERKESPSRKRNDELSSLNKEGGSPRNQLSLTVKITNLPYDVNENDILQMFRGIFIGPENLKLQRNNRGEFSAYVKFLKPRDCNEALSRSRQRNIGGSFPEIIPCSSDEFDNAFQPQQPTTNKSTAHVQPHQRSQDNFCVELLGLPKSCTKEDVRKFFSGLNVLDIVLLEKSDSQLSGFVEFKSAIDCQSALATSGKMMGNKYITVNAVTKEKMNIAQKEEKSKKENFQSAVSKGFSPINKSVKSSSNDDAESVYCLVINNLPKFVKNKDIADFFAQEKTLPQNIHIMMDSKKVPSGEAFAEFTNVHDFERGLQQNGKLLSGSRVSINPITFQEMTNILKGSVSAPTSGALLKSPPDRPVKKPLIPNPPTLDDKMQIRDRLQHDNTASDNFGSRYPRTDSRYPHNDQPGQPYGRGPADTGTNEKLIKTPLSDSTETSPNFGPDEPSQYALDESNSHQGGDEPSPGPRPSRFGSEGPPPGSRPSHFGPDGPPPGPRSSRFGPDGPSRFGPDGPPRFRHDGPSGFGPDGPPHFGPDGPPSRFEPDKPPSHFGPDGPPPRFGPDKPPSHFGPDGPPSRFGSEKPPSRFGPDGPSSRFGPDGPSSRFGPDGPSSRFGPDGPPSRFGPDGPPSRFGPDGPPSRFKPDGPPSRFGPDGPPRFKSDGPPSRFGRDGPPRFGHDGPPRFGPNGPSRYGPNGPTSHFDSDGPPSRHRPDGSQYGPDGPISRHGPDGPISRHGPDGPISRHGPDGPISRHGPDGPISRHGSDGPPSLRYGANGSPSRYGPDGPLLRHGRDGPPSRYGPDGPPPRHGSDGPPPSRPGPDMLPSRRGIDGPSSRRGPDGPASQYDSERHLPLDPERPSRFGPDGPPARFGPDGAPPPPARFGLDGRSPRFQGPPRPLLPKGDGPQDFGMPGCVIGIDNLHFNAGLDELLDVFHGFLLDKDKIIRKYNENGQATGEARIAFQSHEDAVRAVKEVNNKPIFGRPIYLSIV